MFLDPKPEILAPLDRVASALEAKWGPDRLPALVDTALAGRFAVARRQLDEAIEGDDLEVLAHYAAAMVRGWQALDSAAVAAGHRPDDPARVWHCHGDGLHFVLVQDNADAHAATMRWPGASVWTMEQLARVLSARSLTAVIDARRQGLDLTEIRPRAKPPVDWPQGDPLPDGFAT